MIMVLLIEFIYVLMYLLREPILLVLYSIRFRGLYSLFLMLYNLLHLLSNSFWEDFVLSYDSYLFSKIDYIRLFNFNILFKLLKKLVVNDRVLEYNFRIDSI